jgi:MFS transporter, ACS family, hexuronate transporter
MPTSRFKIRGLRWYIAGLLCLVTTINYIDRTSLSVAGPELKKHLDITEQQYSYILAAFQITYGVMQPIAGRVIDWLGTRRGFTLAVTWWSFANILHAFARIPLHFGIFRSLLGIGEAGNFPGVAKTASEWFPPKERTVATGLANIGAGTGALIAFPLVGFIIDRYGWQQAFVFTGLLGFIWVPLWLLLYRSPETHPRLADEELEHIRQKGEEELEVREPAERGVWRLVLRQRSFWGLAIARFFSEPAWQFFSNWIPMYLYVSRGLDTKHISYFLWIPFLAADLGSFVGGMLSPLYQKLGCSLMTSRKIAMLTGACMMPFSLLIASAPDLKWVVIWFCFGPFGHNMISAILLTLPADLFPKRTVATANGLSGSIGYFGGAVFTLIVGRVVSHMGYRPVFGAIAVMDLIGAMFLFAMIRRPQPAPAAAPVRAG